MGKVDLANTTVYATLQTEQLVIPFDFKPYLSAAQFPAKEKDPQIRSKIQLAESLVQNAVACEKAYHIKIRYVVGDKIYAANWFMDKLEQGQMKYFFSLDPKRRVANISHLSLNFDSSNCKNLLSFVTALDFTTSVEVCSEYSLAKTSHRHKIFSFIANFRGLNHKVKVFIFSSSKKIHFYCSNDLDMDFSTALRLYLKRSRIDNVFFKNVKSFLALSRCHFHSLRSYLRHFHICLLLFSIILFFSRLYRKSFYRTFQALIKI